MGDDLVCLGFGWKVGKWKGQMVGGFS